MSGGVWIWTGPDGREKSAAQTAREAAARRRTGALHADDPTGGKWWDGVDGLRLRGRDSPEPGEDDAVLALRSWPEARAGTGQAAGKRVPWIWNARADRVMALGPEEIARRLRREGFSAELSAPEAGSRQLRETAATRGRAGGPAKASATAPSADREGQAARSRWEALRAVQPFGGVGAAEAPGTAAAAAVAGDWRGQVVEHSVVVFGTEAVEIDPAPTGFVRPEPLMRRLQRSSVRALMALGLDMGTVRWRLAGGGRRGTIVDLSPRLILRTQEGERRLREAAASFAADWARECGAQVPDVMLGADAEFVLVSPGGKVVPASRFFSPRAAAGSDSALIGGVLRWPLAELRPAPSREPRAVAARLRGLLAAAARRTAAEPQLRWLAGASPVRGLPLGGHLHISGAALTIERLRALDNAVALPLRLLEPPAAAGRRPRYGALGDCRPKPHGGFEYRTPPSWLVSPLLARGALALAKVAAEHARELASSRPLDDDAMRDAFYGGDRERLLEGARRVHDALRRTAGYALYRQDIEPVFRAIEQGRRWDESRDIRQAWRIPPY